MANVVTPWSTVGQIVAKRTYARRLNEEDINSPTESWPNIVDRVLDASQYQLNVGFTTEESERLRNYMLGLKGTVAGRFLWQLGTGTVDKLGLPSLQNCAFTTVDHPVRPFTWAFDMLMLGSGVGYNIQREYVYKLPPVSETFERPKRNDNSGSDFIVPDSREGWVNLLHHTLSSAFTGGELSPGFSYSTQLVRGKGAPIKGFGGTASGPEDLCRGVDLIGAILESRRGKQLRPIDCLDIMNILGMVVVSGNVRRSAQIALGDFDDIQYLKAKDWSSGNIPNWRAYSNNSVICNDISLLPQAFWDTYNGKSEPYGLINLKLSQACGRLGEIRYRDKLVRGFNPCVTGDTQLLTDNGYFPIGDLVGKQVNVWNGKQFSAVTPFSTGVNELVKVSFTDGSEITCTPYHKFIVKGGTKVAAQDLTGGQPLEKWELPVVSTEGLDLHSRSEAYSQGFYSGDGNTGYTYSYLYDTKYVCAPSLIGSLKDDSVGRKRWLHGEMLDKTFVPVNASLFYKLNWLAGILDSDGTVTRDVNGNGLQIGAIDKEFLLDIRLMLSTMGVKAKVVGGHEAGYRSMPNGKCGHADYYCQQAYRLLVGNSDTYALSLLGLSCHRLGLHKNPPQRDARRFVRVKQVEWIGAEEETFCVTEPLLGNMTVNGIVTGNCAEQSLADYETCCLAEAFLPNIESKEEFLDVAKLLYRVNKHSLSLPCHHKETEDIVHKHMRMGIGITGILQCPEKLEWCDYVYTELRKYDKEYSKQRGWPSSIKLTTCKPSGTLSLLPGVTSGVHPAFAQYMIRRIRIAADHALVDVCKDHGYPVEYQKNFDGTLDYNTVVVEFPFAYPEGTILAEEMTAIDQLEWVKKVQTVWSDNAVSCTVYYTPEEMPTIREYLSTNYNQCFKSLSFLLRSDHGFIQAPIEAINKDEYDRRVAASRLIVDFDDASSLGVDLNGECSSGACPLR